MAQIVKDLSVLGNLNVSGALKTPGSVQTSVITTSATQLTLSAAVHAGRTVVVNTAATATITLPAASGSGNKYTIIVGAAITTGNFVVQVANATDVMIGVTCITASATNLANGFLTSATSDTVTMDGSTKGGAGGDKIEIVDIASGKFQVTVLSSCTGTVATPFSAAVS